MVRAFRSIQHSLLCFLARRSKGRHRFDSLRLLHFPSFASELYTLWETCLVVDKQFEHVLANPLKKRALVPPCSGFAGKRGWRAQQKHKSGGVETFHYLSVTRGRIIGIEFGRAEWAEGKRTWLGAQHLQGGQTQYMKHAGQTRCKAQKQKMVVWLG